MCINCHNYPSLQSYYKCCAFCVCSPQPPKEEEKEAEWSETESDVVHLGDDDFAEFMEEHSSVLVMFYAPCK